MPNKCARSTLPPKKLHHALHARSLQEQRKQRRDERLAVDAQPHVRQVVGELEVCG
jgi:hypothetical protein